jgi:hypothetical protein
MSLPARRRARCSALLPTPSGTPRLELRPIRRARRKKNRTPPLTSRNQAFFAVTAPRNTPDPQPNAPDAPAGRPPTAQLDTPPCCPSGQGRGPSGQGRGSSGQGRGPSGQGRGPSGQGRGSSGQGRGPSGQGGAHLDTLAAHLDRVGAIWTGEGPIWTPQMHLHDGQVGRSGGQRGGVGVGARLLLVQRERAGARTPLYTQWSSSLTRHASHGGGHRRRYAARSSPAKPHQKGSHVSSSQASLWPWRQPDQVGSLRG